MNTYERGRSPSASRATHIRNGTSASPHPPHDPSFPGSNINLASNHFNGLGAQSNAGSFNDISFTQDFSQPGNLYTDFQEQGQKLPQAPTLASQSSDLSDHTFMQSQGFAVQGNTSGFNYSQGGQGSNNVSPGGLSQNYSPASNGNTDAFPSFDNQQSFDQNASLDPTLLSDNDPSALDTYLHGGASNTDASVNPMATMQSHSPTPPHLLPGMARRTSGTPSPSTSPSYQQGNFDAFTRPRNTSESLDPSSALYPQNQNDWPNMSAYRTHRRTPSDNHSEYSSHSNQASPFLQTMDSFENAQSSPLLNSQDPTFNDGLGFERFNLNENQMSQQQQQQQQQQQLYSPHHSPHISPRLNAQQQSLPPFTSADSYGMMQNVNGQYAQQPQPGGLEVFPGMGQEPFPSLNQTSPADHGLADQMSPPEINIDYAPPASQMENQRPANDGEALSPPARAQSRNRIRAKSDSYAGSRSPSPVPSRGRSPSLQPNMQGGDKLSPFDNTSQSSRSPSPARGRNGSLGRARSSSNASGERDYILDLAIPERSPSNSGDKSGRVQKHPATFQCTLCPKRFTRAYNLRSHLRTHTDERPFVCTVCGKAFARQHDRKRHEGLHSGEKKFVCKGQLQSGNQWGCGRRFARADALGRHFRSEAGRVCIKPLLDEEAAERQKAWMEEQQQAQVAAGLVAPQPMVPQPGQFDMMGNFLPAALLQQYPALAGLDWNSIPQGPPPEEGDYSGRSSFDASSGNEYYDDISENEMGGPYQDPGQMNGMNGMNNMNMNQGMGMPQAHPGAGYSMYGGQTGDYLSDFEGR